MFISGAAELPWTRFDKISRAEWAGALNSILHRDSDRANLTARDNPSIHGNDRCNPPTQIRAGRISCVFLCFRSVTAIVYCIFVFYHDLIKAFRFFYFGSFSYCMQFWPVVIRTAFGVVLNWCSACFCCPYCRFIRTAILLTIANTKEFSLGLCQRGRLIWRGELFCLELYFVFYVYCTIMVCFVFTLLLCIFFLL